MRATRILHAIDAGLLRLPVAGPIAVFRPQAGDELVAMGQDRVQVITGFRPDYDAFKAAGYAVATAPEGNYAAALVCLPRARAEARALVAEAAAHLPKGVPLIVDGQKTDGVDSALRELRGRVDLGEAVAKAHGKLAVFAAPGGAAFADWAAVPVDLPDGFRTLPGVFSADGIDPGSAMLAAALPATLPRKVMDLGAGWGFLSRAILAHPEVEELHLVEAEAAALDCARHNITDPRAQFHWADATRFRLPGPVGAVVMNPPFHAGRTAEPLLGVVFIKAAAGMLNPNGTLWMVANRHLPYEPALRAAFRDVEEIGGDGRFRLTRATRPHKPKP